MPKVLIDGVLTDIPASALFADDGTSPFVPPVSQQVQTFTADDMARARQEEKDKLYGRINQNDNVISELQSKVGELTAAEEQRLAAAQAEEQRLAAEQRRQEEEGLSARDLIARRDSEFDSRVNELNQTWEQRFEAEQQARQAAEAAAAKEREFSTLREYTQQAVATHENDIAPQLLEFISGNTQEEIDASIARAVTATQAILEEIQGGQQITDPQAQQYVLQQPQQQIVAPQQLQPLPGTRITGGPANSDPAAQYQTLTAEQIAGMPMGEYAKLRGQMGIGGKGNNRGLFG